MTTDEIALPMPATAPAPERRPFVSPDPDGALFELGQLLRVRGYRFTTITPASHALVNRRQGNEVATDLLGVFGWSRPFLRESMPPEVVEAAGRAGVLHEDGGLLRSTVRFSTIGGLLVVHSGFPTSGRDAVFFGPDTYRFVHLLRQHVVPGGALIELGCGTGAAALWLGDGFARVVMTDLNPLAARYARVNARLNPGTGPVPEIVVGDLFAGVEGSFDAIIANPPFMIDADHRLYRDGGANGFDLALRMLDAALPRLAPEGRLVLYSAVPIIGGTDSFRAEVAQAMGSRPYAYDEIDVDVFGQDLAEPAYAQAERIALVAVTTRGPAVCARPRWRVSRH